MEMTAGVMTAAKSLISWLERNPSSFVTDYKSFKQDILRSTLDLSSILVSVSVCVCVCVCVRACVRACVC